MTCLPVVESESKKMGGSNVLEDGSKADSSRRTPFTFGGTVDDAIQYVACGSRRTMIG